MTAEGIFTNAPVHRSFSAGETIYKEGDTGTHMFGVVSGAVELRKGATTVALLRPHDVFGERALIDHLPRNLSAVATAETVLAEIDQGLFLFLVHETPTFALGVMGALAARLRDYDELFAASESVRPVPELLDHGAVDAALAQGMSWERQGDELVKTRRGTDFADALAYVKAVGALAEEMDHHPDIDIRWNTVTMRLTTHSEGGLTHLDLDLARRIDALSAPGG